MKKMVRLLSALGLSTAIVIGCGERLLYAQNTNDPNAAPNPYRMEEFPVQMPDGRKLGAPIGVEIDQSDGKTLWVYERCGADTCVGSTVDPVMKLDGNGKILANFGGGLVNWPHGFYVDRAGDVWRTVSPHNNQIRTLDPAVCAERKVVLIYCRFVIARSDCDEAIQLLRLAAWIASLRSQ